MSYGLTDEKLHHFDDFYRRPQGKGFLKERTKDGDGTGSGDQKNRSVHNRQNGTELGRPP